MENTKNKLSADLKIALKEKDNIAVSAIRSLMAAIDNAGAVLVEEPKIMPMSGGIAGATDGLGSTEIDRKELSDEDVKQIIQKEVEEMQKAIDIIKDYDRPEIKTLTKQIEVLRKYL